MHGERRRWPILLVVASWLLTAAMVANTKYSRTKADLARQNGAIEAGWRAVDEGLQERAGLIATLADAATQAGVPMDSVREEIADAHAALLAGHGPEERMSANGRLSAGLAKLVQAIHRWPRSKRNRALPRIEEQIRDSDERIAMSRRKYNELLEHYNAGLQRFPANLVGRLAGFSRNDAYFRTEPY